jgi:hypothetical protein
LSREDSEDEGSELDVEVEFEEAEDEQSRLSVSSGQPSSDS